MTNNKKNGNDSFNIDEKKQNEITDYWTPERRKKAIPYPIPTVTKKEKDKLKKKNHSFEERIESIESYIPDSKSESDTSDGEPTNANVKERPFWNGGKLFFTGSDGKDYVGSAQFCGQNNILLTAAHCIRDSETGEWYKNVRFYRAYNNGGGQHVKVAQLTTKSAWVTGVKEVNFQYDYSFLVTSTKSGAGWLGWKTGIPYSNWTAIGYPINYGSCKYMQKVVGTKGKGSGGVIEMLGNPMTNGCSGGAWIGDLTIPHVGGNYAIGLNSYTIHDGNIWGPLFDSGFSDLYYYAISL